MRQTSNRCEKDNNNNNNNNNKRFKFISFSLCTLNYSRKKKLFCDKKKTKKTLCFFN